MFIWKSTCIVSAHLFLRWVDHLSNTIHLIPSFPSNLLLPHSAQPVTKPSFPPPLPPASLSLTWTTALASPARSSYSPIHYSYCSQNDHLLSLLRHFHWLLSPQGEVCLTWHLTFHDRASACHFKSLGTSSQ